MSKSTELNGAVEGHRQLTIKAKKLKAPKNRYFCKVFYTISDTEKEFCELRSPLKERLKNIVKNFSESYPGRILRYSEIKPLKFK